MKKHVKAWLEAHPERSSVWLDERIKDGFDVHHLDGDHDNDHPLNLVLIECGDHMMLHNGKKRFSRVVGTGAGRPKKAEKREKPPVELESLRRTIAELDRQIFQ